MSDDSDSPEYIQRAVTQSNEHWKSAAEIAAAGLILNYLSNRGSPQQQDPMHFEGNGTEPRSNIAYAMHLLGVTIFFLLKLVFFYFIGTLFVAPRTSVIIVAVGAAFYLFAHLPTETENGNDGGNV